MKKLFYIFALVLVLSSMVASISCKNTSPPTEGDEVTMEILNSAASYIRGNHPDAAVFMPDDISFTISSSTGKDIEGYTGVTYSGGGWVISIGHAIVPNYTWGIKADYDNGKILWIGSSQDGRITEESYTRSN